ncbi:Predicted DNA-binding protein, UPF0251 family [Anaerovibrio lipolyticus DSM 3074]|uniref:DNA-binding protein n=2 Tax=Anaerovibrio lipolyticus TaxID=82374 RepID=A0A0B2JVR8_9FIRM|nr:NifB/NifX family molybdenum-iron cluster-binding protein [Anaerovibrio lipolyticus]KHM52445.1 DNA-binding protein [Anaerovibrio lipolyticus]SHI54637.1 Predicted DNA-binding protein, UPF0251 family [Anaerovibrio lipolyticus DSM 3074]
MARPVKKKKICSLPAFTEFIPKNGNKDMPVVLMPVEEYETIRLMDYNGLTQQECAEQMNVARTTVQALYVAARKRIAVCLVEGKPLKIVGGDYEVCSEDHMCSMTRRRKNHCPYNQKGCRIMKLAVTYSNGNIFQHFGKTSQFKIYDIENNKIVNSEVISTNGQGHGALAGILQSLKVDTLICGGIGGGAQNALASAGIALYGGVSGSADEAVDALLAGNLAYDPAVHCNHHGHGHGEGHTCGNHGCQQ